MSIAERAAALREDFAFLDDWEARFSHLIDLGRSISAMPATDMTEDNRVRGCASKVWMTAAPSPVRTGAIRFSCASDAIIVAGLAALILRIVNDERPQDILAFDIDAFFRDIGVAEALTPQRSNGLRSMTARIRETALAWTGAASAGTPPT
jgi:cysteine desulfuration protein SufE